jgi:Raf kinase inhibitor-like YbhB/YbcL family protein
MKHTLAATVVAALLAWGCERGFDLVDPIDPKAAKLSVESDAFSNGGTIPKRHTADGEDVSPPLSWSGAPAGTRSFAVLCEDVDDPGGKFAHWVLFNMPASAQSLPENVAKNADLRDGSRQGANDFHKLGYGGPSPPKGRPHRYAFRVYAVDTMLDQPAGATRDQIRAALKGHVLAAGAVAGQYGR